LLLCCTVIVLLCYYLCHPMYWSCVLYHCHRVLTQLQSTNISIYLNFSSLNHLGEKCTVFTVVQKLTYMSKAPVFSVVSISKFVPGYTAWWETKIWAFCVFVYFGRPGFRCTFVFYFGANSFVLLALISSSGPFLGRETPLVSSRSWVHDDNTRKCWYVLSPTYFPMS